MPGTPRSVLVVDDDTALRALIVRAMAGSGIPVAEAASGLDALTYLERHPPPALILLDLEMPEMAGSEFRRHLLKNSFWAAIPVIVMTGSWIPESALPLGVAGWLSKPFDLPQLVERVAAYCLPSA